MDSMTLDKWRTLDSDCTFAYHHAVVSDRNQAIAALQDVEHLQKEVTDARECTMWLRIVLTNMTQGEQMVGVYERWPWLKGDYDE